MQRNESASQRSGSLAAQQWSGMETAGIGESGSFPAGERESGGISRRSLQGELKAWLSRAAGMNLCSILLFESDRVSMNDKEQKPTEFQKMMGRAKARRMAAMDASYHYKLSKGAPRDIAYEKWGATIDDMIWRDIERDEQKIRKTLFPAKQPTLANTPKKDGPDMDRE